MKLRIDSKNKVVIATGFSHGKKVRAVAICKEPVFDEEFGKELATKKYKIKEAYAKMCYRESYTKSLNSLIKWAENEKKENEKIVNSFDCKIQKLTKECSDFVNTKFN